MKKATKAIVSCAVTGSVHTPSMSAALPLTGAEIARAAIDAANAGAGILHLHARDPRDGRPTPDPAAFMAFLPMIRAGTDAVVNITTGGSSRMTVDERLAAPVTVQPELASLNMGSMNFVFSAAARSISDWKYAWELEHLLSSEDVIFSNTYAQIARIAKTLGDCGTRFEFECYDVGHLYTLAHFADKGTVTPPFLVQCIFGVLGGIGPDLSNLFHMITVADRLFGDDYYLSAVGVGKHQMAFAAAAALAGGGVRVGLEDSLYIERGTLASSNADQVKKVIRILTELGREVATPAEIRDMLYLKGAESVAF